MSRYVLITGAAKRIGRAIAIVFAKAGYSVAVHYNTSKEEAEKLVSELNGITPGSFAIQCEFRDRDALSCLMPNLLKRGIELECLVNSASSYSRLPFEQTAPADALEIYQVNFFAQFELMRSFANAFKRGSIVNITDQRTAFVDAAAGIYGLAKKSLRDITEAAAQAWAPNIRVNAVAPGIILPPPNGEWSKMEKLLAKIPMKERSTEQEVADAVLFLAQSPTVTGQTLYIDGGLHLLGRSVETPK